MEIVGTFLSQITVHFGISGGLFLKWEIIQGHLLLITFINLIHQLSQKNTQQNKISGVTARLHKEDKRLNSFPFFAYIHNLYSYMPQWDGLSGCKELRGWKLCALLIRNKRLWFSVCILHSNSISYCCRTGRKKNIFFLFRKCPYTANSGSLCFPAAVTKERCWNWRPELQF